VKAPRSTRTTVVGRAALTALAVLAASFLAIGSTSQLAQAGPSSGAVLITRPGSLTPLTGGGSGTEFGVALPAGASCPGDTMHDGYLVYSYLVPEGVSPTAVNFKTGVPDRFYGFIAEGAYFGAVNTAQVSGEIVGLPPAFAISRWTTSELLAKGSDTATWHGGIACATAGGVVSRYWDTGFAFRADSSDPRGYSWRVAQPAVAASSHLGLWLGGTLLVVAAGAGVTALVLARRRRRGSPGPEPTVGAPVGTDDRVPQSTGGR
jgi:hypothetical protein